jgi:signal transduction histidine kinase
MKSKTTSDAFRSARLKLWAIYALMTLLIVIIIETSFLALYSRSVYANFDTGIRNRALSIQSSLVSHGIDSFEQSYSSQPQGGLLREPDELIQIQDQGGKILYSSGDPKLPTSPLPPDVFQTIHVQDVVNNKAVAIPIRTTVIRVQLDEGTLVYLRVGKTYDTVRATINSVLVSLFLITPLALILVLILGFRMAGLVLQPVEDSYKALRQFTDDATHELKTPLAIIKTNVDVALSKKEGTDAGYLRNRLELVNRVVDRMSSIVANMSLLSRLDSRSLKTEPARINVYAAAQEKIEEFAGLTNAKGILVTLTGSEDAAIISDPVSLGEILSNLLSNAVAYTGEGGTILTDISRLGSRVRINISDTGMGISPENLQKIFRRFYRSDRSRSRNTGGAGLGLSIVKELVASIGGTIKAQSAEGKGTTFTIDLPAAASDA